MLLRIRLYKGLVGGSEKSPMPPSASVDDAETFSQRVAYGLRNICRCGTYSRIRQAVKAAAQKMQPGQSG